MILITNLTISKKEKEKKLKRKEKKITLWIRSSMSIMDTKKRRVVSPTPIPQVVTVNPVVRWCQVNPVGFWIMTWGPIRVHLHFQYQ